jgi:hypothetical protein
MESEPKLRIVVLTRFLDANRPVDPERAARYEVLDVDHRRLSEMVRTRHTEIERILNIKQSTEKRSVPE